MSGAGDRPAQGAKPGRERRTGAARSQRAGAGRGRPFVLNVRTLRSRPGSRQEVHLAGPIPELAVALSDDDGGEADDSVLEPPMVPAGSEVKFDGWAESTLGGVTIAGTVTAPWSGTCRRCLDVAEGTLVADVRELCIDPNDGSLGALAEEGSEEDVYLVGPDELDVEPIARDACILELPLAPLCSESCLGLCPSCGANLNDDSCSCGEPIDPRWSALVALADSGAGAAALEQVEEVEEAE